MVGKAWQQGLVPQHYAQQTLEKTRVEIAKESQDLTAPPAVVTQLQQTIAQMSRQVDRSPAGAFATALDRLSTQQRQLDRLTKAQEQHISLMYTVFVFAASLLMVAGIDPLKLTLFSMALTALVLPVSIAPFLVLMNDREYVNGWISK